MLKIAVVGKIGAGKSYVAQSFGIPVFNADKEVSKIYEKNINFFKKLKKQIPKYIKSYPIKKREILKSILTNKQNLKKITKIIHPIVRKKMISFLKTHKNKKAIVLDIPLYFENKINRKEDIIIYVDASEKKINANLKKRLNYNRKLLSEFKKIQLESNLKKKKSDYIIVNNFKSYLIKKQIKLLKKNIFKNNIK